MKRGNQSRDQPRTGVESRRVESTGRFGMELGYHAEGRFDRLIQKIKNKPICLPTQKKSVSSLV